MLFFFWVAEARPWLVRLCAHAFLTSFDFIFQFARCFDRLGCSETNTHPDAWATRSYASGRPRSSMACSKKRVGPLHAIDAPLGSA